MSPIRALTVLLCLFASTASAQERIISFHSDIAIQHDGSMRVTETIQVQAEGNQIVRGIFRDFPTDYRDQYGNRYRVGFDVLSVTRDGVREPRQQERLSNGYRLYIGNANEVLPVGIYQYQIVYETTRQIGFFEDHDELYWNVTGNGWVFNIEVASATVSLPEAVDSAELGISGYTGPFGSTGQFYRASVRDGGAEITTAVTLFPGEGLTLVFEFPKGVVAEPTDAQRFQFFVDDNFAALMGSVFLVVCLIILYIFWWLVGKDPAPGNIFPRYSPPENYSPASARFVHNRNYDDRVFVSALVNLAVKGHLQIVNHGETYELKKLESDEKLAAGESALFDQLFYGCEFVILDNEYSEALHAARTVHMNSLRKDYEDVYFSTNEWALAPSAALMVVSFIWLIATQDFTPLAWVPYVLNIILHAAFTVLMQAPSTKGRWLMDRLEGLKLYMEVAEKDLLDRKPKPEMDASLFERLLPFAIAMGVEEAWSQKFKSVLGSIGSAATNVNGDAGIYHPVWYLGDMNFDDLGSFASEVSGGISDVVSASATPPGSESGSVGGGYSGGFSGGGGGGGGGGGW